MPDRNSNLYVVNVGGASRRTAPKSFRGWLHYWHLVAGEYSYNCMAYRCVEPAEVGAHVRLADGRRGNKMWIVPFCKRHNNPNSTDPIPLIRSAILVSVIDIDDLYYI